MPRLPHPSQAVVPALVALALGGACPGTSTGEETCDAGECGAAVDPPRFYAAPPFGAGFDCVQVGCDQSQVLVVSNRGGGRVRVLRMVLTTATSEDFELTLSSPLPVDLARGQELRATVRYRPTDAAPDDGAVRITYELDPAQGPAPEPVTMPLRTRSLGSPVAHLPLEEINYGFVGPGEAMTKQIVIENTSVAGSILAVTGAELEEDSDTAFQVLATFPLYANNGESLSIPVRLAVPLDLSAGRVFRGILHVATSDGAHPDLPVSLIGTGLLAPRIVVQLSNNVLDMGSAAVGSPAVTRVLQLRNMGGSALNVTPSLLGAEGAGFVVEPALGQLPPILPFEFGEVTVHFTALRGGVITATDGSVPYLRLQSNDPVQPDVRVRLDAFGVFPQAQPSVDVLDFGSHVAGWAVEAGTVSVRNSGAGPLTVREVYLEPGTSNQFQVLMVGNLPRDILPEDPPVDVPIRFIPAVLGEAGGNLIVSTNDPVQPLRRVALRGRVITCEEGCPLPHATPVCSSGKCAVGSCESGYSNPDGLDLNGCECGADPGGEVGALCGGGERNLGTFTDEDGDSRTIYGTLSTPDDEDTYWLYAEDAGGVGQLFGDDFDLRIDILAPASGVEFCIRVADHDVQGQGCGGGTEVCGLRTFRRDGSYGTEDGRDVTVRMRLVPGTAPFCAVYALKVQNG